MEFKILESENETFWNSFKMNRDGNFQSDINVENITISFIEDWFSPVHLKNSEFVINIYKDGELVDIFHDVFKDEIETIFLANLAGLGIYNEEPEEWLGMSKKEKLISKLSGTEYEVNYDRGGFYYEEV